MTASMIDSTAVADQSLSVPPRVGFLPILHQMVDSGDLGKLHSRAPALYLAIKRFADFETGRSELSVAKLVRVTGISKPTLYAARDSLKDMGYIDFDDTARPTIYTVFDQVRYLTSDHRPAGTAVLPYVSSRFKSVVDALKGRPLQPDMVTNGINVGGLRVAVSIHVDGEIGGGIRVGLAVDKEEVH